MEGILVTEKEGGQEAGFFFFFNGVKLNEIFSVIHMAIFSFITALHLN